MKNNIEELKDLFYQVKCKGWIESDTNNLGSIGHTFEKLLNIETNELELPDFGEIEIKTKNKFNKSCPDVLLSLINGKILSSINLSISLTAAIVS